MNVSCFFLWVVRATGGRSHGSLGYYSFFLLPLSEWCARARLRDFGVGREEGFEETCKVREAFSVPFVYDPPVVSNMFHLLTPTFIFYILLLLCDFLSLSLFLSFLISPVSIVKF